jgi:hypothetical protein
VFELTLRMEFAEPPDVMPTLVGFKDTVRPEEGETVSARVIVPMNPFALEKVIVDEPEWPTAIPRLAGLAVTAKSVTLTITVVECTREPDVPVIVIV